MTNNNQEQIINNAKSLIWDKTALGKSNLLKHIAQQWKEKGKIQEIPAKIGDYEYLQAGFDNITLEEMLKDVFLINQTNELLIKKEKEAKSDLEKKKKELEEKTTLLEKKVIELEQTNQELEEALELEEETSECHLEALEVAKEWRIRQSKEKDDKIEMLRNAVIWQSYLRGKELKELPSLPKKEKRFKLLSNKVKNKVSQTKEIVREKFNAYILQKSK